MSEEILKFKVEIGGNLNICKTVIIERIILYKTFIIEDYENLTSEDNFNILSMNVYFKTRGMDSWDTEKYGIIYSNQSFLIDLRKYLKTLGFTHEDLLNINSSESGLQTHNRVNYDIDIGLLGKIDELSEINEMFDWGYTGEQNAEIILY